MKKITALALPLFSYLSFSLPALAATGPIQIQPCTGNFTALCTLGTGNIGSIVNAVITLMFVVAVLVALAFLIWGGIKWITSGGDKAGVEAARNQIVAALVGLVIVFLSYFLLNFLMRFFGLGDIPTILTIPSLGL